MNKKTLNFSPLKAGIALLCEMCLFIGGMGNAYAADEYSTLQQPTLITVNGVVNDTAGEPVIGAGIVEKGTTNGSVSGLDGRFTLRVKPEAVLEVSCVGYSTVEVTAGPAFLTIVLEDSFDFLDEAVAIGYGTQKKRDLTGAVASVSEEKFADLAVNDITQALAGRVAGLDIGSSGIDPGSTSTMVMRGHRSFVATNDPLIILDGMTFNGSLNDINPYDIKSIDVLKDASSTAIYGSKGANGVIIITSKRGSEGKVKVQYEGQVTVGIPHHMAFMNAEQFVNKMREGGRTTGLEGDALESYVAKRLGSSEWDFYKKGGDTDWQRLVLQNSFRQKHQVSVSGGSQSVKYNIGMNYLGDEGIIPTRAMDRVTLTPSLDIKVSDNVSVGVSSLISYSNRHSNVSSMAYEDVRALPGTAFPYDENGELIIKPSNTASWYMNPRIEIETDAYRAQDKTFSTYVNGYFQWNIFPSLTYRMNASADISARSNKSAAMSNSSARHADGDIASISNTENMHKSIENILTWDKIFGHNHITLTGVQSWQDSHMESSSVSVNQIPFFPAHWNNIGAAAGIKDYGSNLQEWQLLSFAARAFYSYKDKYLLTLSARADGASQFAEGHKWGFFPSAAFAWRISDEPFMSGTKDWLSNLKLRLSYGVSGNQGISPYQTQGALTGTLYSFDDAEGLGMRPGDLANSDLKWEKTAVTNIGLDFGFFKGRISGSIEAYKSHTTDLLLYRQIPVTTGFTSTLQNIGSTQNTGFEITINTANIVKRDFSWNTDFIFYLNREKILELYNGAVDDIGNRWFIGHPISVYYSWISDGIWQLDEAAEAASFERKPGQIKVVDLDKDGSITDFDRTIIGTKQPDFVANMVNSFKYKNFDLSFEIGVRWGQMVNCSSLSSQEGATNGNNIAVNYWTPENPGGEYPRPDENSRGYQQGDVLGKYDGSFIRLKNASLGYTLPANILSKINIDKVRVYVNAYNPYTWSKAGLCKKYGIDPETGSSSPIVNSWTLGLNITF